MIQFLGQVQNLTQTSQPAAEPVSLATAKLHLKMDAITDDDALISALITAARERLETEVHRAFVSRTYLLALNGFPYAGAPSTAMVVNSERMPNIAFGRIKIPKPPLISIQSIQYVDNNGVTQTIDPSLYLVNSGGKLQGVVTPAFGLCWPESRYQMGSVQVAYTAGFGDATTVPASICQAMLLLIGAWYNNKEAVIYGSMTPLPMGVKALMSSFNWGSYG